MLWWLCQLVFGPAVMNPVCTCLPFSAGGAHPAPLLFWAPNVWGLQLFASKYYVNCRHRPFGGCSRHALTLRPELHMLHVQVLRLHSNEFAVQCCCPCAACLPASAL